MKTLTMVMSLAIVVAIASAGALEFLGEHPDQENQQYSLDQLAHLRSGATSAIGALGEYLIFGVHDDLLLYDVRGPESPSLVSVIALGALINHVVVRGHLVYVVTEASTLIVDYSSLSQPVVSGQIPVSIPGAIPLGIAVHDTLAFVIETGSLTVHDVSNSAQPTRLSQTSFDLGIVWDMDYYNEVLYVCTGDSFLIYQVDNSNSPKLVREIPESGARRWQGVTIVDDLMFAAQQTGGLSVYDVADEVNPVELGNVELAGSVREPVVRGDVLFVPAGREGLHALTIAIPDSPKLISTLKLQSDSWRAVAIEDYLYIAAKALGVYIVDIDDPASLRVADSIEGPSPSRDVVALEGYTIVLMEFGRLLIYDTSNPKSPRLVKRILLSEQAVAPDMIYHQGALYVLLGGADRELVLVDVSVPGEAAVVSKERLGAGFATMATCGEFMFTGSFDEIISFNISESLNPVRVHSLRRVGMDVKGMACNGFNLFAVGSAQGGGPGLLVFEANPLGELQELSEVRLPGQQLPRALALSEDSVYIGLDGGLVVVDVSDVSAPTTRDFQGEFDHIGPVGALTSSDDLLFAGSRGSKKIWVLDTRLPSSPETVGWSTVDIAQINSMYLREDILAVAAAQHGWFLLRLSDHASGTGTPTPDVSPTPSATLGLTASPNPSATSTLVPPTLPPHRILLPLTLATY